MEKQENHSSNNKINKETYRQDIKNESELFDFNQRRNNQSKKNIEDLINETQQIATGLSKDSSNCMTRIKANIYEMANKVGVNFYDLEIKKLISKNQKILSELKDNKDHFEIKLNGNDNKDGLIKEKNILSEKITKLNSLINKLYLANKEFENEKDNLEEKIDVSKEKNDFDSLEILRSEQDKISFEHEEISNKIENYEDDYFYTINIFKETEKEIDEKKITIRHLKNNIQNYQKEINTYQKFLGDKSEIISYLQTNKLLEKSNIEIRGLLKTNQLVEEKSYFAKNKILAETKSISSNRSNLVRDEQRKDILKDKQERKDNLSRVNEAYSQIMKR